MYLIVGNYLKTKNNTREIKRAIRKGRIPVAQQKNNLKMAVIIVLLVLLVGVFGYLNAKGERLDEGKLRITAGNDIIGEISLEEVRQLPAVNKKMVINSTSGLTKHKFTCTSLQEVFDYIDPEIVKQYKRVIARGVDNYISGVNMEEVRQKNNVLLVYEDNDLPLKSKTGSEGTMRIVIVNDVYGQRFTNYLVEIQLE